MVILKGQRLQQLQKRNPIISAYKKSTSNIKTQTWKNVCYAKSIHLFNLLNTRQSSIKAKKLRDKGDFIMTKGSIP